MFYSVCLSSGQGCRLAAEEALSSNLIPTTTIGQELIDLKAAYEKGVITKEQYENQKEKILDRD